MNKKCIEIVNSGANVIYERGLWSKEERKKVKQYFEENNIETELHYIHVLVLHYSYILHIKSLIPL